jgi:uncharacterized protein YbaR (Trm112 family)
LKKHLLDILACPIDKFYPLELFELSSRMKPVEGSTEDQAELVIEEGILYCDQCSRFYPIIDEIPIILPDELRDRERDIQFLQKWRDRIPNKVISDPRPYSI